METLNLIATHPITWAVIGILVKALSPAFVPFLGAGRKLVKELTELHDESPLKNDKIKEHASELGLKVAEKWIQQQLVQKKQA